MQHKLSLKHKYSTIPEAQFALYSTLRDQGRKAAPKAEKKGSSKERTHTSNAAVLGSVAGFPEQLFWGDCGLGLCSEVQGEAWPEF